MLDKNFKAKRIIDMKQIQNCFDSAAPYIADIIVANHIAALSARNRKMLDLTPLRRVFYLIISFLCIVAFIKPANADELKFSELYSKISVLGLEFAQKVHDLNQKKVDMRGFMAPPLKAEAKFFVLTEIPMSICPFCSSDSDWPDNIVVVYLDKKQTFVQPSQNIIVTGRLDVGSWTDPETGFVSQLRLLDAQYRVE